MTKQLRDVEQYSNIYITPDLTPEEQAKDKALRAELKRRRSKGEVVEIRRGRIVSMSAYQNQSRRTDVSQEGGSSEAGYAETVPKRVE